MKNKAMMLVKTALGAAMAGVGPMANPGELAVKANDGSLCVKVIDGKVQVVLDPGAGGPAPMAGPSGPPIPPGPPAAGPPGPPPGPPGGGEGY